MPEWIVAVSVGPVGGFIGGGRRSRDLWWGSTWVSECTLAVARKLPPQGLIVPSASRLEEIVPEGRAYGGRISNQILASLPAAGSGEVEEAVRRAVAEAHTHLAAQLRAARSRVESRRGRAPEALRLILDADFFSEQVAAVEAGEFVEVFAAWTPVDGSHAAAIRRARQLLAARKSARLFEAPRTSRRGRRKCDLDAGRDTVLHSARIADAEKVGGEAARHHLARKRLGIGPDEELDAVSLGRRIAVFEREGGREPELGRLPFPPITRVAADPWLRRVVADPRTEADLERIRQVLRLAKEDEIFFTWCSPALDPEVAWSERNQKPECLPFDASFLLEGGLEALQREIERVGSRLHEPGQVAGTLELLARLTPPVRHLHAVHGAPPPYFALLFMDGDGVGRALGEAPDKAALQTLIRQLDDYADQAEPRLREDHFGRAFYIGGDDLAAYLPVDMALGAARALADRFDSLVQRPGDEGQPLTLSGGIVIGHAKADLRGLRRHAQAALSEAKRLRRETPPKAGEQAAGTPGWLRVVELPRSGSPRACAGPLHELAARLAQWQESLQEGVLSLRSPRLLLGLRDRFADPRAPGGGTLGIELARHRVQAQIERSSKDANPVLTQHLETISTWRDAEELASELAIAARFHRLGALRPTEKKEATP